MLKLEDGGGSTQREPSYPKLITAGLCQGLSQVTYRVSNIVTITTMFTQEAWVIPTSATHLPGLWSAHLPYQASFFSVPETIQTTKEVTIVIHGSDAVQRK